MSKNRVGYNFSKLKSSNFAINIVVPTDLKLIAETLERVSQYDVISIKFTSLDLSGPASYQQQNDLKCVGYKCHCLCIKCFDSFISQNSRVFRLLFM